MHPDSPERLWLPARIDLLIEKVGHGLVIKRHVNPGAGLGHELHIFDEQEIVRRGDPETTNFRVTCITQK
jgi:hypothetical protein